MHVQTQHPNPAGILLNAIAAVLDTRTKAIVAQPSLRCGAPADPIVTMTFGTYCALDQRQGGSRHYSCGCIIPGSDPGNSDSCLAFYGPSGAGVDCDAGARVLGGLVGASVILCWTLAALCLIAAVTRVASSCYRHRRCPALWWRRPEEQMPPYLRNSKAAAPSSSRMEKGEAEKEQKPGKARVPEQYYLRDSPNGAV